MNPVKALESHGSMGDGVGIDVTLLFSQKVCRDVARAYIRGLQSMSPRMAIPSLDAGAANFRQPPRHLVDKQLNEEMARGNDRSEKERLAALRGEVAIDNAKMAAALDAATGDALN